MADLNNYEIKKIFEKWIKNSNYDFNIDDLIRSATVLDYEMSSTEYYTALRKLGYDYDRYSKFKNKFFYKEVNYKMFINQAVNHLMYELEQEEKQIVAELQFELEEYK